MKRYLSFTFIIVFLFIGCSKDDDGVEEIFDGSTHSIIEFIGNDIYYEMVDLGLKIHPGNNPPNIEGKYLMSPSILENSNIPSDVNGRQFGDLLLEFLNQKGLEIQYTGEQSNISSVGKGSFISGSGENFSVFLHVIATKPNQPNEMEEILVFSGRIAPEGIYDIQCALFMIENNGNTGVIENGQGRIFIDEDGLAERQPSDFQRVPDNKEVNYWTKIQD